VGEDYFYRFYSYSIVLRSESPYISSYAGSFTEETDSASANYDPQYQQPPPPALGISLLNANALKLVENLVFSTQSFVTSCPPLAPEIKFRSFIGNEKRIQISFGNQETPIKAVPFMMTQEEELRMRRIKSSQGDINAAEVTFKNDDEVKVYEIYRTKTPPTTLNDFKGKLHRRVTDSSVLENVSVDTTYYYMFRTIDAHGNVSNPSKTFELTLMGGFSPYLVYEEYNYQTAYPSNKMKDRKMRRFLRLRPAMQQLFIDDHNLAGVESSRDVSSRPTLGVANDGTVWGKKFKIRLTSIETGKKIDYNVEYDYDFERREE